jgi:hypothetical protein
MLWQCDGELADAASRKLKSQLGIPSPLVVQPPLGALVHLVALLDPSGA